MRKIFVSMCIFLLLFTSFNYTNATNDSNISQALTVLYSKLDNTLPLIEDRINKLDWILKKINLIKSNKWSKLNNKSKDLLMTMEWLIKLKIIEYKNELETESINLNELLWINYNNSNSNPFINLVSKTCPSTDNNYWWHAFNTPIMANLEVYSKYFTETIKNWSVIYYNDYKCENWTTNVIMTRGIKSVNCNSWYSQTWDTCNLNHFSPYSTTPPPSIEWWYNNTYWNLSEWHKTLLGTFSIDKNQSYNINEDLIVEIQHKYWSWVSPRILFNDIYISDEYWNIINNFIHQDSPILASNPWYFYKVKRTRTYNVYWIIKSITAWNETITLSINEINWKEYSYFRSSNWTNIWNTIYWK